MQTTLNHTPSTVLMVRPAAFGFNAETMLTNKFQNKSEESTDKAKIETIAKQAEQEFDNYVQSLRDKGVQVEVFQDTKEPVKPDAVFPNNWITFHHDGKIITFPMQADSRKLERRDDIPEKLKEKYDVREVIKSLTDFEKENKYLEGTGSIVFDYPAKIAYAVLSPRTDKEVLEKLCNEIIGFKAVAFKGTDDNGADVYHSNVFMSCCENYFIICDEYIRDEAERKMVMDQIKETKKEVISISGEQLKNFCGNVFEVKNDKGKRFLVMSTTAEKAFTAEQKAKIEELGAEFLPVNVEVIEKYGGGSARCMLAGMHLPLKK